MLTSEAVERLASGGSVTVSRSAEYRGPTPMDKMVGLAILPTLAD